MTTATTATTTTTIDNNNNKLNDVLFWYKGKGFLL